MEVQILIEKINEGDMVLCKDDKGNPTYKEVVVKSIHLGFDDKLYQFVLENGMQI